MAQTVTLQRIQQAAGPAQRTIVGPFTGTVYVVNSLGQVTVDTADQAYLVAQGYIPALGGSQGANSGVAVLDFGAFPGSASTSVVVSIEDISDPNAELDVWVIPVATVDHTADEHVADPPRVIAANTNPVTGGSFTISGFPSGRDLAVPPGTPFGGASSQMPIASQQLMPVGKWSVAWAFSP